MLRELAVRSSVWTFALALWGAVDAPRPAAARDAPEVGVVSHVKVLSDKVEDVSSPEAWRKSYIKDDMSDQEKLLAIWRTVVKYRHQTDPPNEYIQDNVHDVFKTIHVYGYGMCCCAASHVETLARYLGLEARGWGITRHSRRQDRFGRGHQAGRDGLARPQRHEHVATRREWRIWPGSRIFTTCDS